MSNILAGLKGIFHSRTRKAAFLVAVIVGALAATVYAYYMLLPSPAGPRVSIKSPPLEFSIELSKTEYEFGGNITIIFCMKNISNETITVVKPYWWPYDPEGWWGDLFTEADKASIPLGDHLVSMLFHFGLLLVDSNGTEVYKLYKGYLPATYDIVLEPYGYIKQTYIWVTADVNPVAKGTYQLRGMLQCDVLGVFTLAILETPSITITIK